MMLAATCHFITTPRCWSRMTRTGDKFKFVRRGFRQPEVGMSSFDRNERENPYCRLQCRCTIPLTCLNDLFGSQICPPSRSNLTT